MKKWDKEREKDRIKLIEESGKEREKDRIKLIEERGKEWEKDNIKLIEERGKEWEKDNIKLIEEFDSEQEKNNIKSIEEMVKKVGKIRIKLIEETGKEQEDRIKLIEEMVKEHRIKLIEEMVKEWEKDRIKLIEEICKIVMNHVEHHLYDTIDKLLDWSEDFATKYPYLVLITLEKLKETHEILLKEKKDYEEYQEYKDEIVKHLEKEKNWNKKKFPEITKKVLSVLKSINRSSTSALVLLLATDSITDVVHTSQAAKRYLDTLYLAPGQEMYAKCMRFWPHYPDVIKNRKTCILEMTDDAIRGGITQVVVFGAGFDVLSLDVVSRFKDCRFFEVDVANMDEKNQIIRSVDSLLGNRIRCIEMDISGSADVMAVLVEHGWDVDAPSLVIFEGISYYLPESTLWSVINMFGSISKQNQIILEYMVPNGEIQRERVPVAEYLFNLIAGDSELCRITQYGAEDIESRIRNLGGRLLRHDGMMEIEKRRTSENTVFPTARSGWIRVCNFAI